MLKRLKAYADDRLGWFCLDTKLKRAPIIGGARWRFVPGSILLWLFALEFATGLGLMTVYAPSAQTAWSSVFYIQHHFAWGPLVRGIHHWAAQAMIVVIGIHILQVLFAGAYKPPRDINWWLGLLLFGLAFMSAHSGSLLPWDQQAYWI